MNHQKDRYEQYVKEDPIIIGDNCWLATNATILPGVRLENHVIVAAGAVVTKSIPEDYVIIAGVPACVEKKIAPYAGNLDQDSSTDEL